MNEPPYLTYARYLRERHGCTVYRVAVDAGFGCPNRGAGRAGAGCTYCAAGGSRAPYLDPAGRSGARADNALPGCADQGAELQRQILKATDFLRRRYGVEDFVLFFQAYSNTYAPVAELRRVYDAGLAVMPFRGLSIATRPDCVDGEKADLIASYRERGLDVWVELGLQSANEETLRRIGRGHTVADFARACGMLKDRGVHVAAHLIFGLPGEGRAEIEETIRTLATLGVDGVKIHNLHVPRGTALAADYLLGEITVPGAPRHLEYVIVAIEMLPPGTVVMRLTCDTPARELAAPRWFWTKDRFAREVAAQMRARGARQGRLCTPAA
jgi:hypothetical protein